MYIIKSRHQADSRDQGDDDLNSATLKYLRNTVNTISIPRHYVAENRNNRLIGEWIKKEFDNIGLVSSYQGEYNNVVATFKNSPGNFTILVGAHYDTVPGSPGADDNASAVAGLLAVARSLSSHNQLPVIFVAFNREEDGLIGSQQFVDALLPEQIKTIRCVHILEMIGYCRHEPGTQHLPAELPVSISDIGDFIGIIANRHSNKLLKPIINLAEQFVSSLPVTALKVFMGVEKFFPHLRRSDHAPFWDSKIPALMWTDTSEFRNPNYHQPKDLPDTLDYAFINKVVKLLEKTILYQLDAG